MSRNSRRPVVLGTAIATTGILLSGAGASYAANGGSFILGQDNYATKTTRLVDTYSTPLSLWGSTSMAPMSVNSSVKVANLNADKLDGLDSTNFQRKGAVTRQGETTFTPSEGPINRQSRAYCAWGEHAVGGGGRVQALTSDRLGEYFTFIVHSTPIGANGEAAANGTQAVGWLVEATNTANKMTGQTGRNANLISHVICEPN